MAESIWNWFKRLLLTIIMLLVISILGLVAVNVPGVFDTVNKFGDVAYPVSKAAKSVTDTSELAYDVLEKISEEQE